jgi:hypothetical protein
MSAVRRRQPSTERPLLVDYLSAVQNICLPTRPEIDTALARHGWSAGDVDPRFSNLVPLHDFKHPRLPTWGRSTRISMTPDGCGSSGGARRDRTDDLMLAKHALSQLSYGPFQRTARGKLVPAAMVGLGRLERPTSPLSGVRSNHLSYRPEHGRTGAASGAPDHALSGEERETKTAASRI